MKEKYYVLTIGLFIAFICIFFIVKDKPLDLKSAEISELYSYLGEVDIYHCGGLSTYSSDEVTKDDISDANRLCMAYYNLDDQAKTSKTSAITGKNENDVKICQVEEGIAFSADENTECSYTEIKKTDLEKSYLDIYGSKPKIGNFNITNSDICYLKEDTYYCGKAQTYNIAVMPETSIYRLKKNALKRFNGDIVISDYFLKIVNNTCYLTSGEEESSDCTEALSKFEDFEAESDSVKADFIRKYGKLYKHTFKKLNDDYYWSKSK